MVQIIASNPISASTFRRGLAHRARANGVASASAIPLRVATEPRARLPVAVRAGALPGSRARATVVAPGRFPVAIPADFRAVRCRAGLGVFDETPEDDAAPAAAFDAALDDLLDDEDEEADASGDDADGSFDASLDDDESRDANSDSSSAASDSEPDEDRRVLGGAVTDLFSALVLEMRAGGHGEVGAGAKDAQVAQVSSWSNPEPWSTFDGMHAGQVRSCLGDVRRTLKAYAATRAPAGALNERLMGAVGAAWFETLASAGGDKSAAFVWGGGEKFAGLLVDTCVHRVLFRDEPAAAGNRLVADTLMTLQDLATSRVPLSADATTVALSACRAFIDDINDADAPGRAAARLAAAAPPASDTATETAARGAIRLGGRTGYTPEKRQRVVAGDAGSGSFYDGRGARNATRRDARGRFDDDEYRNRKDGDWDCAECGFMNFASRYECYKCGAAGGGGGGYARRGPVDPYSRREDRFAPKPGDWTCPGCNFSNFASRVECKRCGEPGGGGGGGGGGYGGGGWDRDAPAVRSWSDDRGDRGFDRGFDRGARYGRGAEGGSSRGYGGNRRSGGGGRGGGRGRGGRDRGGGWDDADAGGWNDGNGDAGFGGY